MARRPVVLVAETPSLATALAGLLEAEAFTVRMVPTALVLRQVLAESTYTTALVIVASNAFASETVRLWGRATYARLPLLVIGARDPSVRSHGSVHVLDLPIRPTELLAAVRRLSVLRRRRPPVTEYSRRAHST